MLFSHMCLFKSTVSVLRFSSIRESSFSREIGAKLVADDESIGGPGG